MFLPTKMQHDYIVWSSHGNITDGASIITNFNHSQKHLLHGINNAFRYNFGLQQFFNSHVIAHVVHPENLVYTNLFDMNYTGPSILYISKFYTIFVPSPPLCNILLLSVGKFQLDLTPPQSNLLIPTLDAFWVPKR